MTSSGRLTLEHVDIFSRGPSQRTGGRAGFSTREWSVASRCISVDHRVLRATKEIPPCMAIGDAPVVTTKNCEGSEMSEILDSPTHYRGHDRRSISSYVDSDAGRKSISFF
jgi:hypothetical protein